MHYARKHNVYCTQYNSRGEKRKKKLSFDTHKHVQENKKNNIKGLKISICPFLLQPFSAVAFVQHDVQVNECSVFRRECRSLEKNCHKMTNLMRNRKKELTRSVHTRTPIPRIQCHWLLGWLAFVVIQNIGFNLSRASAHYVRGGLITRMRQQCTVILFSLFFLSFFLLFLCDLYGLLFISSCWSVLFFLFTDVCFVLCVFFSFNRRRKKRHKLQVNVRAIVSAFCSTLPQHNRTIMV